MKTRTENKFLRWRKHVERKRHFVLVAFPLEPAEEGGGIEHPCCSVLFPELARTLAHALSFYCLGFRSSCGGSKVGRTD